MTHLSRAVWVATQGGSVSAARPWLRRLHAAIRQGEPSSQRTSRSASTSAAHAAAAASRPQIRMLLVGSPGSGKGTLSSMLCSSYTSEEGGGGATRAKRDSGPSEKSSSPPLLRTISAGDLLRKHIEQNTDVGIQAKEVVESGGLMPDDIMTEMVGREVKELDNRHWLLDGFPRTQGQAQLLDIALAETQRPLNLVINLDVPESVILARILERWVHPASGRVYNLSYNPPRRAGFDDVTGEPLVRRSDDNEETLRRRLQSFHRFTGPMIEHFARNSSLAVVEGASISQIPLADDSHLGEDGGASRATAAARVYVNLKGETSKEIWPKLQETVRRRFGM